MKTLIVLCLILVQTGAGWCAELQWDYNTAGGAVIPPTANVQHAPLATGPYSTIATIPSLPAVYPLEPEAYGWYRILNDGGVSNSVEYPMPDPPPPDLTIIEAEIATIKGRLDLVEAAIAKLNQPPVSEVNNISSSQLNVDQVEIVGVACTSLKTTGSGLKRIITCVH